MPLTKVSSGVIAANAVVDSFGTQSITGDKIGLGAITGNTLASNIINANNIVNASITGDKLGLTAINANNIVDGAVTVSKGGTGLSTLTANSILIGNGTSSPQFIAPGTSANVLTSNGTNWTSSALAGSPLVFIATTNVTSPVSAVTFSNLDANTYISYMLSYEGIVTSSGSTSLMLQLGNNITIIADSPSNYLISRATNDTDGSSLSIINTAGSSRIELTNTSPYTDALGGVNGIAWISNLNNGAAPAVRAQSHFYNSNLGILYNIECSASLIVTNCITQLRIKFITGNISSGRVTVYGLKAS